MAMVNMNNLLNGKDSRWLQLEVCREFQRNKCTRPDTECKFAHPPANVEVQNGRVTACYDSIKGRCNREKPPCKYFHPPQHLKDQLLINGRNHLALKNALMHQMGLTPGQTLVPGQVPAVQEVTAPPPSSHHHHLQQQIQQQLLATHAFMATNPYLTGMPQVGSTYSPYFAPGPIMPAIMGPADPTGGVGSPLGVVPQTVAVPQKMPRSDRLEMDMKSVGSFYYENFAFPGMVPYKRPAGDKSGMPVYQPSGAATTYQQLMQLQQPFVPVSCEYAGVTPTNHHHPPPPSIVTTTLQSSQTSNNNSNLMNSNSGSNNNNTNASNPGNINNNNNNNHHHHQSAAVAAAVANHQLHTAGSGSGSGSAGSAGPAAQASSLASENTNGVLVDPANPPPPPPGGLSVGGVDKQGSEGAEGAVIRPRTSPELNHHHPHSHSHPHSHHQTPHHQHHLPPSMSPAAMTSIASLMSNPSMCTSLASMSSMAASMHANMQAHYTMANINALNNFNAVQSLAMDPAALAKEVAQKNYAKAVKLSASQASYGINPLTALNYTGVALNKQALAMPPPSISAPPATPRPPQPGLGLQGLAGIPGALAASPLSAGLFHYPRPPPQPQPINPYSLMRPHHQMLPTSYMQTVPLGSIQGMQGNPYAAAAAAAAAATHQGHPYAAMLPPGIPGVSGVPQGGATGLQAQLASGNAATIVAQPQVALSSANTGVQVITQPYKKMKTT